MSLGAHRTAETSQTELGTELAIEDDMTKTTEISIDRIISLQRESAQAGDRATVNDCSVVLHGADDEISAEKVALSMARIAKVLANAEAQ